jgi:glyoxylase-like metal-dependent hydrolase (beta-lactamase superfamily II)
MTDATHEIYAIRYAHHDRPSSENFLRGDLHNVNEPLAYFVWAIVGPHGTFIVDTGFGADMAAKRGRTIVHPVVEGLKAMNIAADEVTDVIITHLHYDHCGNHDLFPKARYHLQESEMHYCTGRYMCHGVMRLPFEADDVVAMVRRLYAGGVQFHDGSDELAPGLTVHHVGGHTMGLQVARVWTKRGWVVLASDASHLYANMDQGRPFPIVFNVGDMLEGHKTLRRLADSPNHVVPGHDPLVLKRYPAARPDLAGSIVRLDLEPKIAA